MASRPSRSPASLPTNEEKTIGRVALLTQKQVDVVVVCDDESSGHEGWRFSRRGEAGKRLNL
jgi:hypothetical protein